MKYTNNIWNTSAQYDQTIFETNQKQLNEICTYTIALDVYINIQKYVIRKNIMKCDQKYGCLKINKYYII